MENNIQEIKELTLDQATIIGHVTEETGIGFSDMKAKTRKRPIAKARLITVFFMYFTDNGTQEDIAKIFGYIGHYQVGYSKKFVQDHYSADRKFREEINILCDKIDPNIRVQLQKLVA